MKNLRKKIKLLVTQRKFYQFSFSFSQALVIEKYRGKGKKKGLRYIWLPTNLRKNMKKQKQKEKKLKGNKK